MGLWGKLARVFGRRDASARQEAERILLEADFGVVAAEELLARLDRVPERDLEAALEREVTALLDGGPGAGRIAHAADPPTIVLLFGVNGVGKTTTAAKLAHRLRGEGRSALLGAADTFRAGAVSQLRAWAERLEVPFVGPTGDGKGDPGAVAFDAVEAARARGIDTVIVDTAGRLHTDAQLLAELAKVARVAVKPHPSARAPHESFLVLDGTVGQSAVQQATTFAAALPLTGLIVTKLDGTARGGAVVALRRAVPVPVRFVAAGEGLDDLEPFDAARYARRLVAG